MKRFIALMCTLVLLATLAGCVKHNDPAADTTLVLHDPQKENALPADELTEFATATQSLTNYRLAHLYTSDTENISTIVMHDGKNEQRQIVFYNKISNGAATLDKKENVRYVWSENARYVTVNDKTTKYDHKFNLPADKTTFGEMVNQLVCPGFYEKIIERMSNATYDVINDCYWLESIEIGHNKETWMFDDVYVTIENGLLTGITCKNGTQTIEISVTGVNDVDFSK